MVKTHFSTLWSTHSFSVLHFQNSVVTEPEEVEWLICPSWIFKSFFSSKEKKSGWVMVWYDMTCILESGHCEWSVHNFCVHSLTFQHVSVSGSSPTLLMTYLNWKMIVAYALHVMESHFLFLFFLFLVLVVFISIFSHTLFAFECYLDTWRRFPLRGRIWKVNTMFVVIDFIHLIEWFFYIYFKKYISIYI